MTPFLAPDQPGREPAATDPCLTHMGALSITLRRIEPGWVLEFRGAASMLEVDAMSRELNRVVASRPRLVVLDLSGLHFIASLAIGELFAMSRGVRGHGGTVAIAAAPPLIRQVLDRCNVESIMPVYDTVEAAIPA